MSSPEYLLNYGALGDFGRFSAVTPLACRRGQRAVVRGPRGVEMATVLGEARPGHAAFLPDTTVGQLLRLATPHDEDEERRCRERGGLLLDEARKRAAESALPLEALDVEYLLDGEHAVLHYVRWDDFDPRPFVSGLSRQFAVRLTLEDLTNAGAAGHHEAEQEHGHGCGRPGCGSESGGGCGSEGGGCGTGGGCSTCGLKNVVDLKAYFAKLREQMAGGAASDSYAR